MTSVAIISGQVSRIQYLKQQVKQSEWFRNGAENMLQGLKMVEEQLIAAYGDERKKAAEFPALEKEIVMLSYDIVQRLTVMATRGKIKLQYLEKKLQDLQKKLQDLEKNLENEKGGPEQITDNSEASNIDIEENPGSSSVSDIRAEAEENRERSTDSGIRAEENRKRRKASDIRAEENRESSKVLLDRMKIELSKESFMVLCILGKRGMGKTTFAKKLFHDHHNFDVRAWVSIPQNFQMERFLLDLLQQLDPPKGVDIRDMKGIKLIEKIFNISMNTRFLIVLDDVWKKEIWQSIRPALPNFISDRIIITTSSDDVAEAAATTKESIFKISGFIQSDIITILQEEKLNFNPDSNVPKAISDISGGSPLIATILGKSLLTATASTASERELVQELESYMPQKGTPQVLGLSYKVLSPEIKAFLLYLGQFPLGKVIEVGKLYALLAVDDLITSSEESDTYLQIKKNFLEELDRRNLVQVQEDILSKDGVYKSCKLHEVVRDFCISKGLDEDFIEIVNFESEKKFGPNTRRVAVYMSKYRYDNKFTQFSSNDRVNKIRSLQIFDTFASKKAPRWPSEINDLKDFESLIILSFEESDFRIRRYPKGIEKLRLLRYLSFQGCWLEELPSSLSKLINLETLDLLVHPDCQMYIPSHILVNMKALVHLYLPRKYVCDEKTKKQKWYHSPHVGDGKSKLQLQGLEKKWYHSPHVGDGKSKLQLQGLENLETLVNFNTQVCDITCLSQLKKLKIFTTISNGQGKDLSDLEPFVDNSESSPKKLSVDLRKFNHYNREGVEIFKKLLKCPRLHSIHTMGPIGELTLDGEPDENIAEIVLNGSHLERDAMTVLARFQNLRRLDLTDDAFLISEIVISCTTQFSNLRSLKLQNLQYIQNLRIEEGALPQLSSFEIDRCRRLTDASIPKELHNRLVKARAENVGAYWVMPKPANFRITPSHCEVASTSYHTQEITESA